MCCEFCPKYDDCMVDDKLKDRCCRICPDYDICFAKDEESEEEEEE